MEHRGDVDARPHPPGVEALHRKIAIVVLGCLLLLGFILPVATLKPDRRTGTTVEFKSVNIDVLSDVLSERGTTALMRFMAIYPAAAGALVVLLAFAKPVEPRAIGLMLLGIIPFVVVFVDEDVRKFFGKALEGQGGLVFGMLATVGIGWMCLFAGARSRCWRPGKTGAYGIGVAGAVMFGVGLLIPALPKEAGRVLLLMPFFAIGHEGTGWVVFYMLLQLACVIAAAAVCLTNRPRQPFEISRRWASVAFMLIIAGIVVGVVCGLQIMVESAPPEVAISGYFPIIVTAAKFFAWWLGLALLIPFGITDWLVGDPFAKDLKTVLDEMKHRRPPGDVRP